MNLLFLDPESVTGTYYGDVGVATGTPHFINLDTVMWCSVNRGNVSLFLTMANGGIWKLEYTNHAEYHRVTRLFFDNAYDPKEG